MLVVEAYEWQQMVGITYDSSDQQDAIGDGAVAEGPYDPRPGHLKAGLHPEGLLRRLAVFHVRCLQRPAAGRTSTG
jgi:hypothetical protein